MLTPRFVVAWIESHDWVEAGDLDPNAWPNGPLVGPGSTYGDPSNPRSGVMYLRHFGGWDESLSLTIFKRAVAISRPLPRIQGEPSGPQKG
jgi:hypothetical protein